MSDTMEMQLAVPQTDRAPGAADRSIGRIVSVTGSKAIVLLDSTKGGQVRSVGSVRAAGTPPPAAADDPPAAPPAAP